MVSVTQSRDAKNGLCLLCRFFIHFNSTVEAICNSLYNIQLNISIFFVVIELRMQILNDFLMLLELLPILLFHCVEFKLVLETFLLDLLFLSIVLFKNPRKVCLVGFIQVSERIDMRVQMLDR